MQIASLVPPTPTPAESGRSDATATKDDGDTTGFMTILSQALAALRGDQPGDAAGEQSDGEEIDGEETGSEVDVLVEVLADEAKGAVEADAPEAEELLAEEVEEEEVDLAETTEPASEQLIEGIEVASDEAAGPNEASEAGDVAGRDEAPRAELVGAEEMAEVEGLETEDAAVEVTDLVEETSDTDGSEVSTTGEPATGTASTAGAASADTEEREILAEPVDDGVAQTLVPDDVNAAAGAASTPTEAAPVATDPDAGPSRAGARAVADTPVVSTPVNESHSTPTVREPASVASAMFEAELEALEADDPWQQVARVVRPLRQLADGTHRIALQLRPAELGSVHLEVALEDGRLSMRAVTDTVAARDALAAALPELRGELTRSGIDLGSLDVGDETTSGDSAEERLDHDTDPSATDRDRLGAGEGGPGEGPSAPIDHQSVAPGRLDLTL